MKTSATHQIISENWLQTCKAYRYIFSQKSSVSMLSRQPKKCLYGILVHTTPFQALPL